MSDDPVQPHARPNPYGPTTVAEIKPMRLAKAISVMEERLQFLEEQVRGRVATGGPAGYKLREMAAIKALLREVIG